MSWILNVTYRIMYGLKVKVEEILIKLKYCLNNFRVKEIPISFNKRAAGESKRDLVKFIGSYIRQ